MDEERARIEALIAALDEAFYRRDHSDPGFWNALASRYYSGPYTDEEIAIWTELTAPHNHASLRSFVEESLKAPIADYAANLFRRMLDESTRRLEAGSQSENREC